MIFFAGRFIFGKVPDKAIFGNYLRSRYLMSIALLLLSANYAVHLFVDIRTIDAYAA